jgi:hypothetical protein
MQKFYDLVREYPIILFIMLLTIVFIADGCLTSLGNKENNAHQLEMAKLGLVQDKDGHWVKDK